MSLPSPERRTAWRRGALMLGTTTLLGLGACSAPAPEHERQALRVCADPNNLPFSNADGQGFENRIAELLADDLGMDVHYTWHAQRRGFVRSTLGDSLCDIIPGIVASSERVLATRPYYRSTYVFTVRTDAAPALRAIRSFDDQVLRDARIGVHVIGDDYTNTPPAHALANRDIVHNVHGYTLYGDYSLPDPPLALLTALVTRDIDVAIVWGPFAGWAQKLGAPLTLHPVQPQIDLPFLPMVYDIAMGVRRQDVALRDRIDAALTRRADDVARILEDYGVPRAPAMTVARRAP
jgi:mxaJ protein